jgi:aspartate ammonia-lyase
LAREAEGLTVVNLGATAIGTGFGAPPGYADAALAHLSETAGERWTKAPNLVGATQNSEALAHVASRLKVAAVSISKMATDIRLMSSGPRTGLGEIRIPAMQPGSSIMPGKVNPVVTMLVNQVACLAAGYDVAVSMATEGGELELNHNTSLAFYCIHESARLTGLGARLLGQSCVDGIEANAEATEQSVANSLVMASALLPAVGYRRAWELAAEAADRGVTLRELVIESGELTADEAVRLLDPRELIPDGAGEAPPSRSRRTR